MDAELTDPLGRLSPLYDLGTEMTIRPRGGGTGSNIKDSDIAETLANRPNLFGATQEQAIDDAVKTARGIRAYHSSPHDFEKFDASKIGTGEGHQTYGHGLYFAENPKVSGQGGRYWDEFLYRMESGPERIAALALQANKFDRDKAISHLEKESNYHADQGTPKKYGYNPNFEENSRFNAEIYKEAAEHLLSGKLAGPRTYEVNINAHPEHFLDWDKPFDDQSTYIKQVLTKFIGEGKIQPAIMNLKGENIHAHIKSKIGGTPEEASKFLSENNIKGIKYLDSASRTKGKGTSNYVVFDPNDIEIMRRYARGGDVRQHFVEGGPVDDMRKAIDLAKSMYTPKPDEPFTQGHLLPIKKYESGRLEFDPTAGVLGQVSELGSGIKNLMTGNTPVFEINDQGETVPNQQAIGTALNVAGNIIGGGIPASALERSGGMMLGTSGSRMVPEAAAVELAKRELSPVGLYSHGAEAARSIPQAKGAAEQMVGMLRKQPGVSENELINAGILTPEGQLHPDFASRGTISREDLSSHLQSSMPQVEETILGGRQPYDAKRLEQLQNEYALLKEHPIDAPSFGEDKYNEMIRLMNIRDQSSTSSLYRAADEAMFTAQRAQRRGDHVTAEKYFREHELLNTRAEKLDLEGHGMENPAKYFEYTLPGGENYREVLLKLPFKLKERISPDEIIAKWEQIAQAKYQQSYASLPIHLRNEIAQESGLNKQTNWPDNAFKTPHWNDPNVLAHIRMADRTGPNGEKILHVEEVQSDWGQKGKKEGFWSEEKQAQKDAANEELKNMNKELRDRYKDMLINQFNYDERTAHARAAQNSPRGMADMFGIQEIYDDAVNRASMQTGLPSAPYVTSTQGWTDLALKRILKEAAEGGYDKVVWTPGAEQVGRYDLSKSLSKIAYNPDTGYFQALDLNGKPAINQKIETSKLPDLVGKETAEKLLSQKPNNLGVHQLETSDLTIGGEGMKEYYDKILPNRLQSVAKKHDKNAKVGYTDVMLPPSGKRGTNNPPIQAPGLDITPQMRESILKGQGAFQRGGRTMGNNAIGNALRLASGGDADIEMPRSLKELQDWNKTHSRKKPVNMDDYFTNKVTGVEGANPVSMPNDLNELIAYLRRQRDAGGRTGFGFGGDSDAAEGSSYSENIDRYTPEVSHADIERASMEALDRAYNAGELSRPTERDSVFTGSMNRGLPEDGGPSFKVDDSMGGGRGIPEGSESLFKPDPSYTGQIGRQPQLGGINIGKSLYDQARDASNSYGMAYGHLVGKKYTDAGVAGLLGNAMYESAGLNPAAINPFSGATGLFQHLGDRKAKLLDAVNASGLTGDELKDALQGTESAQLAFALNEAATNPAYKLTQKALETATDPYKASDVVMKNFERPGAIDEALTGGLRSAYANQIYQGVPSAATMTPEELQASTPGFKATNASGTGLERFFGTTDNRIAELENQNKYAGGDRNAVASALGVDPSQLKARIVEVNGQPKVDYYTKSLSDALKFDFSNPFSGSQSSYSGPKGPNMDVVNADIANRAAQERSSYGPYGDLTREEYRALYGGKDTSNIINAAVAAAQPTTVAAPYTTQLGKLSLQLPSITGQTAQQWADANTGGDLSKVNARIKYVGGAPRLEYYTV